METGCSSCGWGDGPVDLSRSGRRENGKSGASLRAALAQDGFTLIEVVFAAAVLGMSIMVILATVSASLLSLRVMRSIDLRMTLAQQVLEELEAETAVEGAIPDRFASMSAPQMFEDTPAYSYQVWIDDVSVGGETMCDLRRVKVSVFRTDESMDQAVILVTIVRLDL
jgi:type II secretory pathway pseudopilin PulG